MYFQYYPPVIGWSADSTQLYHSCHVGSEVEVGVLQYDLNKIWSQDWQMLFNVDKTKVK